MRKKMGDQPDQGHQPWVYMPGLRCKDGRKASSGVLDPEKGKPLKDRRLRWAPETMAARARIAREAQSREAAGMIGTDGAGNGHEGNCDGFGLVRRAAALV